MRTSGMLLCFFYAPVLYLFLNTKNAVDSLQLSAPDVVTGAIGGSLQISCQYDQQFRDHTKYWCRGSLYGLCSIVVKTPRNRHSDRHFIADDKEAGVFTVTMTSLRQDDQDWYWCVIARSGTNIHKAVRLLISHRVITTTAATTTTTTIASTTIVPTTTTATTTAATTAATTNATTNATTTATSSLPMTQDETCWWAILRWIVCILMLCCLVLTHIVAWRIKTAKKPQPRRRSRHQNIYN